MTSTEVHAALVGVAGAMQGHARRGSSEFFFENALEVEYGRANRVSFIGASYFPGCGCEFALSGVNPWEISSHDLFLRLAALDGGSHEYTGTEYIFPRIIVSLWDADTQYDHLGGHAKPVWAQVGVGDAEYLGVRAEE